MDTVITRRPPQAKDIRQSLDQKYHEIEERIRTVEKHQSIARIGAAVYNAFNSVYSNTRDVQPGGKLSLHIFLTVFLSALRKPPSTAPSASSLLPLAWMESASDQGRPLRGPSGRSLLSQQTQGSMKSLSLASPRGNGFDTVGEIIAKMLQQLMPLVRDVSDWYKFVLHMLWLLERQHEGDVLSYQTAALEAAARSLDLNGSSVPVVRDVN